MDFDRWRWTSSVHIVKWVIGKHYHKTAQPAMTILIPVTFVLGSAAAASTVVT